MIVYSVVPGRSYPGTYQVCIQSPDMRWPEPIWGSTRKFTAIRYAVQESRAQVRAGIPAEVKR